MPFVWDSLKLNYFLESTIWYCLQGRINHLLIICLFDAKKKVTTWDVGLQRKN
jgi:hypothetical protein